MKPLTGYQLPLISGVAPYLVSNPAACAICTQKRAAKGIKGSCPVCEWRETAPNLTLPPAQLLGTSRKRINSEIERAEYARLHGIKYDLLWGTHYRKNGQHWQVSPLEFEAVVFHPPEQRPYIELPS